MYTDKNCTTNNLTFTALICISKVTGYCPKDWSVDRSSCYCVYNTSVTWQQAVYVCEKSSSALLTLNDITEQTFILHLRPSSTFVHHWISLHRNLTRWIWIQMTNTTINHLNTTEIEPDENCAALSKLGTWIPRKCEDKLPFICESNIDGQRSPYATHVSNNYNTNTYWSTASPRQPSIQHTDGALHVHTDTMILLEQCLTGINQVTVDDCLRDVFKSNTEICSLPNPVNKQLAPSTLIRTDFYKNFVQHVENFIEEDLSFSECGQGNVQAFDMIEIILNHFHPDGNLTYDGHIQVHSEHLEISFRRLQKKSTTSTTVFESCITGCTLEEIYFQTDTHGNRSLDIDILVAVLDIQTAVRVHLEEGDYEENVQYYLVSPVLVISAYIHGRKISVGHQFTTSYHSVEDLAKMKMLNITHHALACVYYKSEIRQWSNDGCKVSNMGSYSVTCKCQHTTSFGVIMKIKTYENSKVNELFLSVITYIGCGISMLTMFLALTVFTCIRALQSERIFVHRNLCIAILCSQIVFLSAAKAIQHKIVCRVAALVLHYCFMSVFTWMLVEGLHLYIQVVQVFGTEKSRNNYYLFFGWGLPLVLVMMSAAADWEGYGTETSCWLSIDRKTVWAFVGPAIAVIVVNVLILTMVLRVVVTSARNCRHAKAFQVRAAIKASLFLLHLLGLTWIFGLMAVNRQTVVFEYLFAISNSLQGFFVFLFHCVLNTEVRQALGRVRDRRAVVIEDLQTDSSSTDSNTSASVAVEGNMRFHLSFKGVGKRSKSSRQNAWATEHNDNFKQTVTRNQAPSCHLDVIPHGHGSKMNQQKVSKQTNRLSLIYL